MYIVIAGGGVVGLNIATLLSVENHDVVVIEESGQALESIKRQLDVRIVQGNAATPRVLREAEAHRADLVLAVTDSDETNMVVCFISKEMGAARTAARIRNPDYSGYFQMPAKSPIATRRIVRPKNLGIDVYINPEAEMAREILSILAGFYSTPAEEFGSGTVRIREFRIEDDNLAGKKLSEIAQDIPFFIVAVGHNEGGVIANPEEIIHSGDSLYIAIPADHVERLAKLFAGAKRPNRNVVVIGGGSIGYLVAEGLIRQGVQVKILERDQVRAEEIATKLERALVLQGEPTDRDFLLEQGISKADAVVSVTQNDELNILATLLAKTLGVSRALSMINNPDFLPLAEAAGIDVAGSPAIITARKIAHFVLRGGAVAASVLENNTLEAIEFIVSPKAKIVGKPVSDIPVPKNALIVAVVRDGRPSVPPDEYPIDVDDRVIVMSTIPALPEVEKLFK
ncbi:Trk system potassium transporter TrkA [Dehalogenimonas etheniformans]|uniref:Trk system potassium uptake protein TrkA n=1 Tax=Dehalogenimonas etheniformans TaxID=1536648 RepID=A0A2P5P763_9CHLR|nr:Trk system potassium transporter TrkA [Dehalogenimonas etheniformans]PPD58143.1 Trk system potassium transporter TrkA [Dehalogenimonas etheniformans]QNT75550.1 Trk system potassium transporter TrkA [Dehalogenimonas etheniformans]